MFIIFFEEHNVWCPYVTDSYHSDQSLQYVWVSHKGTPFKRLSDDFQVEIYLPGDNVILAGEYINKLYVIVRGRCEIVDPKDDTVVIKLLKENDFFGETSLLHGTNCERTVRSATYCVINVLARNSFNTVRKNHPEFGQSLDATIMKKFVNSTHWNYRGYIHYKLPKGTLITDIYCARYFVRSMCACK